MHLGSFPNAYLPATFTGKKKVLEGSSKSDLGPPPEKGLVKPLPLSAIMLIRMFIDADASRVGKSTSTTPMR